MRATPLLLVLLAPLPACVGVSVGDSSVGTIQGAAAVEVRAADSDDLLDAALVFAPSSGLCERLQATTDRWIAEDARWRDAQQEPWPVDPDWSEPAYRRAVCERQREHFRISADIRNDLGPSSGWFGTIRPHPGNTWGVGFAEGVYSADEDGTGTVGTVSAGVTYRDWSAWARYADGPADCDLFAEADLGSQEADWNSLAFEPDDDEQLESEDRYWLADGRLDLEEGAGGWTASVDGRLWRYARRGELFELDGEFETCVLQAERWNLSALALLP